MEANIGSAWMFPGPGGSGVVQEYSNVASAQLEPWFEYTMLLYAVPPLTVPSQFPPPTPPPCGAELPVTVQLTSMLAEVPPPLSPARLPMMVQLRSELSSVPPPIPTAELPESVQWYRRLQAAPPPAQAELAVRMQLYSDPPQTPPP